MHALQNKFGSKIGKDSILENRFVICRLPMKNQIIRTRNLERILDMCQPNVLCNKEETSRLAGWGLGICRTGEMADVAFPTTSNSEFIQ
jgi:hypothetical protein